MASVVQRISDDDLIKATPCENYSVGDLLDHVGGGALVFRAAAVKQQLASQGSGSHGLCVQVDSAIQFLQCLSHIR